MDALGVFENNFERNQKNPSPEANRMFYYTLKSCLVP